MLHVIASVSAGGAVLALCYAATVRNAWRSTLEDKRRLDRDLADARMALAMLRRQVGEANNRLHVTQHKLSKFAVKPRGEGGKFLPLTQHHA